MTTYDHTLKIRLKDNQEKTFEKSNSGFLFELNLFFIQCFNPISKKVNKSPSKELSSPTLSERNFKRNEFNSIKTKKSTENKNYIFTTNGKSIFFFCKLYLSLKQLTKFLRSKEKAKDQISEHIK